MTRLIYFYLSHPLVSLLFSKQLRRSPWLQYQVTNTGYCLNLSISYNLTRNQHYSLKFCWIALSFQQKLQIFLGQAQNILTSGAYMRTIFFVQVLRAMQEFYWQYVSYLWKVFEGRQSRYFFMKGQGKMFVFGFVQDWRSMGTSKFMQLLARICSRVGRFSSWQSSIDQTRKLTYFEMIRPKGECPSLQDSLKSFPFMLLRTSFSE